MTCISSSAQQAVMAALRTPSQFVSAKNDIFLAKKHVKKAIASPRKEEPYSFSKNVFLSRLHYNSDRTRQKTSYKDRHVLRHFRELRDNNGCQKDDSFLVWKMLDRKFSRKVGGCSVDDPLEFNARKTMAATATVSIRATVSPLTCFPHKDHGSSKDDEMGCREFSQQMLKASEDQKKAERNLRRVKGLGLLNLLAALYGTSAVAVKFIEDEAPEAPASLLSLIRFLSAAVVFAPALPRALSQKTVSMTKAGIELGVWNFLGCLALASSSSASSDSNAPLLFAFSVLVLPLLDLRSGQPVNKPMWLATITALTGMGVLEEENQNWRGLPDLQLSDFGGILAASASAIHIFRSESLGMKFNATELTAIQATVLALFGFIWEAYSLCASGQDLGDLTGQLQSIPWGPVLYGGLICSGLCNWLELQCLYDIPASTAILVYTTIPVWGACFSFLILGEAPAVSVAPAAAVVLFSVFNSQASLMEETVPAISEKGNRQPDKNRGKEQHHSEDKLKQAGTKSEVKATSHLRAAILTSQLKIPFYAMQAKRLLAEIKVKLGIAKAFLISLQISSTSWYDHFHSANNNFSGVGTPSQLSAGGAAVPDAFGRFFADIIAAGIIAITQISQVTEIIPALLASGASSIASTLNSTASVVNLAVKASEDNHG